MKTKALIVLSLILIALTLLLGKSYGYEAVDMEIVKESLTTLRDHSDLPEMLKQCKVTDVFWHWDAGLYLGIMQDCNKTILVDVLSDYPTYERYNTDELTFTSMS